jgi:putative transposase
MSTHQQLLYHIVFSTKCRRRWLTDGFRESVFAYMAGTTKTLNGFAIKVGGFYDHAHLLVRIPAKIAVSDFVGQLKASTSKHINETSGLIQKFGWQVESEPSLLAFHPKTLYTRTLTTRWSITKIRPSRTSIWRC